MTLGAAEFDKIIKHWKSSMIFFSGSRILIPDFCRKIKPAKPDEHLLACRVKLWCLHAINELLKKDMSYGK
jgi:hypothetical protein